MELNDLAKQVLFSSKIEDKLICPDVVSDNTPGKVILTPDAPGRPEHLRMRSKEKVPFPGVHKINSDEERGVLMHFLANHELLALELMALVLLKFPNAPKKFRRGVYGTLREEQEHTSWYIQRMKECNIEFGSIPVNDFFWRNISTMDSPMSYVSKLSLTFELRLYSLREPIGNIF